MLFSPQTFVKSFSFPDFSLILGKSIGFQLLLLSWGLKTSTVRLAKQAHPDFYSDRNLVVVRLKVECIHSLNVQLLQLNIISRTKFSVHPFSNSWKTRFFAILYAILLSNWRTVLFYSILFYFWHIFRISNKFIGTFPKVCEIVDCS